MNARATNAHARVDTLEFSGICSIRNRRAHAPVGRTRHRTIDSLATLGDSMNTRHGLRLAVRGALLGAATLVLLPTAQAAPAGEDLKLEEVVVTAQRREEQIQDVPVAVSAFNPVEMERRQAFNVVDIVSNVPNLVGNNNIGQGTATTVFLRGIGSTESIVTLETALGFYIDDVYISRQGVNNLSLYDVERVEVLRGPQGTLYGRNTTGGALKVITARPNSEFGGSAEASYGEYNRWSLKGSINVPLSDTFFMRAGAFVEQGDGYSDNLFNGREVNDRNGWGGRVAFRWVPTDTYEGIFSVDYYKSDQNGLYAADIAGIIAPRAKDLFTVNSGTDTSNIGETYGASLTLNFNLSDALQLQSITGFRNVYQKWNLDLTDEPVSMFLLRTINDTDSYSQELKLNGRAMDDRLKYTAGIFGYKEENFSFIGDQITLWFPGPTRVPLPYFGREYDMDVTSYAAFAEVEFALTSQLKLIAGGRYTHDDKDLDIDARVAGTPGFELNGFPNYNNATLNALGTPTSLSYSKFTPKVGLQYVFSPDVNAYLVYSQGWKSGGWSARTNAPEEFVVFDPETVNSYELGVKTTIADGRARLNYTAFYYDYKDFFSTATGQAGNFIVFTSDAEFYGVEFETTARLTDRFDVFAALGWQEGSYKDLDPVVFGTSIGSEPQRMPEWTAKVGGTYTWPLQNGELKLTADYQFLEDHFTNLQNSELARSGDINLVNASLGYTFGDTGRYTVALSCRNCFDDEYISQSLDFSGIDPRSTSFNPSAPNAFNGLSFLTVYAGPPREWLVTFRTRF
jgi:iron complex outermembrane receptor protein